MSMLTDFSIAYVMIKAELGKAAEVAAGVSGKDGVRWAVVVTGPFDVIAGVRVGDNEALWSVVEEIQQVSRVTETLTAVMSAYYVDGAQERGPRNGPP